jgi:hypothetical protein
VADPHRAGLCWPASQLSQRPGRQGDFTGFVQWDREECVGADKLDGDAGDSRLSLRFDSIRSIARRSRDSSLVTLLNGREIVLSGTNDVNQDNRGVYVDDQRYGRVLVSWDAFERLAPHGRGDGDKHGSGARQLDLSRILDCTRGPTEIAAGRRRGNRRW